jgi:hypothetical protein
MSYTYTDQNNNVYHISASEIRYVPVTAAESSSGVYSGGEKVSVRIQKEDFKQIAELINDLVNNSEGHTSKRTMGTSILNIRSDTGSKQIKLLRSKQRTELEQLLHDLKNS